MNKPKSDFKLFAIILMILAVCFTLIFTYYPKILPMSEAENQFTYQSQIFDEDALLKINILVDETSWQEMLDTANEENYIQADIMINNEVFNHVGIRPKGNSSLSSVYSSDSDRYSFKIEFDHYQDGKNAYGLDKLVLNNIQSDASYLKEFMSYDLFRFMDVPASYAVMSEVYLNGEYWGCYVALEAIEESFAMRNFQASYGQFYKPENTMGMRGGESTQNNEGTDLAYIDDNVSSYSTLLDAAIFDQDAVSEQRVIAALKALSTGENLEESFDVEEIIRYIACNTFLNNMDSYFGNMLHNYYLYEEKGLLQMIPWDYNLAFGGFQQNDESSVINLAIDTPISGITIDKRPLINQLLSNYEYKAYYYEQLQKIVDEYINSNVFSNKITEMASLIDHSVANDPTSFTSYEEFTNAIPTLIKYGELRAKSIQGQLDGIIPSTTKEQNEASESLIDVSDFSLSNLGTQGGRGNIKNELAPSDKPEGDDEMQDKPIGFNPELMKQARSILENTTEISDEQKHQLYDLGLDDEQISEIFDMQQNMDKKDRGEMPEGGGESPTARTTTIDKTQLVLVGGCLILSILICRVAMKYKRK